jgi:uncharacterized protein (TIGR00255 family)
MEMLMRGMTGYGQAKASDDRYEATVEIHSVNKRHLEIQFRMPRECQQAEGELRKTIALSVHRGQVTLHVVLNVLSTEVSAPINWPWVERQKKTLQAICERLNVDLPVEELALTLFENKECFCENKESVYKNISPLLHMALKDALEQFDQHRRAEGEALMKDLFTRREALIGIMKKIRDRSSTHAQKIREKLVQLVEEAVPSLPIDDRLLREVVLYADKADVSEELGRIDHHLTHMEQIFGQKEACGKLLEFLLQEVLREFNTLGAKTIDSDVSTAVVIAKTELEKMREQVQNVE